MISYNYVVQEIIDRGASLGTFVRMYGAWPYYRLETLQAYLEDNDEEEYQHGPYCDCARCWPDDTHGPDIVDEA